MFRTLIFVTGMLAVSGSAFAQDGASTDSQGRHIIYQDITELDLEGSDVTASVDGPQLGFHIEPKRAQFAPMIRLRVDFNQEMSSSTTEVR